MEKLTDDLNIIRNLADRPTQNASDLKGEFDEAANIIKNYLNNTVHPTIEGLLTSIKGKISASEFETLKNEINTLVATKLGSVDTAIAKLTNTATSYGDFEITVTDSKTLDHGNGGTKTDTQDIKKEGYFPLGIVGYELSGTMTPNYANTLPTLLSSYLSNRVVGSCKTNVKIIYANNDQWTYKSTYKLHILWVKVKQTETV